MLGWRGMAGLIVPSNNSVVLPEVSSLMPEGVTAYEARMLSGSHVTTETVNRMIEDAKSAGAMLEEAGVNFVAYCCMGSSVMKGWQWEDGLLAELAEVAKCPVTSANRSMLRALQHVGAKTCALMTPYPPELNALLPDFFAVGKVTITSISHIEVRSFGETPAHNRDVRFVEPAHIYRAAREVDVSGVDALCVLATDIQTLPAIAAIERDVGVPVITSNQAIAWEIMRGLGLKDTVAGYGRLLNGG